MQTITKASLATSKRSGGIWVIRENLGVMLDLFHTQLLAELLDWPGDIHLLPKGM